jgi:hypothetical protein
MRCSFWSRLAPLHAGGDLPPALGAGVERHAARCAPCARALDALREDRARLLAAKAEAPAAAAREPDPLGEQFWHGIRRELRSEGLCGPNRAERPPLTFRRREVRRALALRSLAVAASIVLAALLFLPRPGPSGAPESVAGPAAAVPPLAMHLEPTLRPVDASGAGAPGPYLERVAVPVSESRRSAIEESQPLAPPGVQYHLEGWHASESDRETLSF